MPVFGWHALQALRTFGRQALIYHSALAVILSCIRTEAAWQDLVKKTTIICLEVLSLLNFTGGLSLTWKKPHWRLLLLGLCVVLVYKSLVTCDDIPDLFWPASVKFSKYVKVPFHPNPPQFLGQLEGPLVVVTLPYTQVMMEDPIQTSLWKIQTVLPHFSAIHGSFLITCFTLAMLCLVATVTGWPQQSSFPNSMWQNWNSLCHLWTVVCSGDWSPKQLDKLLKHHWKDYPWR